MDRNPTRNKKLAKQMAAQEAAKPTVQSLPPGTWQAITMDSVALTTLATSTYAATTSTNALLQYWNNPPTFRAPEHIPDNPAIGLLKIRNEELSNRWQVGVTAYATVNGQLFVQNEMLDRAMWDSDGGFRAFAIRSVKRRLVEQIMDKVTAEVFVDGQLWTEPPKTS